MTNHPNRSRAKIFGNDHGVTLSYVCHRTCEQRERHFFLSGNRVMERVAPSLTAREGVAEVRPRLNGPGWHLSVSENRRLIDVIRDAYRDMRRAERVEDRGYR
jgi:hypothetical protein